VSPFPVLDPEPPPRPFWRAALIPGAVVGVIAIAVALILILPGALTSKPHKTPAAWPSQVPGEIIGWNVSAHTLVAMTPIGVLRQPSVLASNITFSPEVSPSGFGVLEPPGHLFYLENRHLNPASEPFVSDTLQNEEEYSFWPFADHDTALVVGGTDPNGKYHVPVVIDVNSTNHSPLPGPRVDEVYGDPATFGAWVTVAQGKPVESVSGASQEFQQQLDSSVQHRTPHKKPVTLVTATKLERIAGITSKRGVELTVYPSPSGRLVAIDVEAAGASTPTTSPPEAVVVLTRTGQLVGKLSTPALREVNWASSSKQLLIDSAPGTIATWVPGQAPSAPIHLAPSQNGWGTCLFSPTDAYVVCGQFGNNLSVLKWALIRLSDHAVVTEPAHEVPVDWSP
jgi:hypothetical protein